MDLMKNPNFTTELANLLVKEYAKQQKEKA
jgi:hypothetical protein